MVRGILEARGKRLKSLVIFGSSIYSPMRARDLDVLVVADKLVDVAEKSALEIEIAKALRTAHPRISIDVIVFDEGSFRENLEPGALPSGLIAGYEIIHDELGLKDLITELMEKVARGEYVVQKSGRRINLSALARMKLRLLGAGFKEAREQNRPRQD